MATCADVRKWSVRVLMNGEFGAVQFESRCYAPNSDSASRCSESVRANLRSICRVPPFHALHAALALPSGLRGPVDFLHGLHVRMRSAWRLRCSGVLK